MFFLTKSRFAAASCDVVIAVYWHRTVLQIMKETFTCSVWNDEGDEKTKTSSDEEQANWPSPSDAEKQETTII